MKPQQIDPAHAHGLENSKRNWTGMPTGVFTAFAAVLFLLAACAAQRAQAQTFTVLHSFTGFPDGANPYAGLVRDSAANLYGTTFLGGSSDYGTLFKIDTTGTETVLHNFTGAATGGIPVEV